MYFSSLINYLKISAKNAKYFQIGKWVKRRFALPSTEPDDFLVIENALWEMRWQISFAGCESCASLFC
jgi:hypothetical protein